MKISELPDGLRQLADKRAEDSKDPFPLRPDDVNYGFDWRATPEGWGFWDEVNSGNFSVYYGCKVTNCVPKNK